MFVLYIKTVRRESLKIAKQNEREKNNKNKGNRVCAFVTRKIRKIIEITIYLWYYYVYVCVCVCVEFEL